MFGSCSLFAERLAASSSSHRPPHVPPLQVLLDDHLVKTQSMRASPFVKAIEAQVLAWEALLGAAQEMLDSWLTCQVGAQSTWAAKGWAGPDSIAADAGTKSGLLHQPCFEPAFPPVPEILAIPGAHLQQC